MFSIALKSYRLEPLGKLPEDDFKVWASVTLIQGGRPSPWCWYAEEASAGGSEANLGKTSVIAGWAASFNYVREAQAVQVDENGVSRLAAQSCLLRVYRGGARNASTDSLIGWALLPFTEVISSGRRTFKRRLALSAPASCPLPPNAAALYPTSDAASSSSTSSPPSPGSYTGTVALEVTAGAALSELMLGGRLFTLSALRLDPVPAQWSLPGWETEHPEDTAARCRAACPTRFVASVCTPATAAPSGQHQQQQVHLGHGQLTYRRRLVAAAKLAAGAAVEGDSGASSPPVPVPPPAKETKDAKAAREVAEAAERARWLAAAHAAYEWSVMWEPSPLFLSGASVSSLKQEASSSAPPNGTASLAVTIRTVQVEAAAGHADTTYFLPPGLRLLREDCSSRGELVLPISALLQPGGETSAGEVRLLPAPPISEAEAAEEAAAAAARELLWEAEKAAAAAAASAQQAGAAGGGGDKGRKAGAKPGPAVATATPSPASAPTTTTSSSKGAVAPPTNTQPPAAGAGSKGKPAGKGAPAGAPPPPPEAVAPAASSPPVPHPLEATACLLSWSLGIDRPIIPVAPAPPRDLDHTVQQLLPARPPAPSAPPRPDATQRFRQVVAVSAAEVVRIHAEVCSGTRAGAAYPTGAAAGAGDPLGASSSSAHSTKVALVASLRESGAYAGIRQRMLQCAAEVCEERFSGLPGAGVSGGDPTNPAHWEEQARLTARLYEYLMGHLHVALNAASKELAESYSAASAAAVRADLQGGAFPASPTAFAGQSNSPSSPRLRAPSISGPLSRTVLAPAPGAHGSSRARRGSLEGISFPALPRAGSISSVGSGPTTTQLQQQSVGSSARGSAEQWGGQPPTSTRAAGAAMPDAAATFRAKPAEEEELPPPPAPSPRQEASSQRWRRMAAEAEYLGYRDRAVELHKCRIAAAETAAAGGHTGGSYDPEPWADFGAALLRWGYGARAEMALREAVSIQPSHIAALATLALLEVQKGAPAAGITFAGGAVKAALAAAAPAFAPAAALAILPVLHGLHSLALLTAGGRDADAGAALRSAVRALRVRLGAEWNLADAAPSATEAASAGQEEQDEEEEDNDSPAAVVQRCGSAAAVYLQCARFALDAGAPIVARKALELAGNALVDATTAPRAYTAELLVLRSRVFLSVMGADARVAPGSGWASPPPQDQGTGTHPLLASGSWTTAPVAVSGAGEAYDGAFLTAVQAEAGLERAVELSPDCGDAWFALAQLQQSGLLQRTQAPEEGAAGYILRTTPLACGTRQFEQLSAEESNQIARLLQLGIAATTAHDGVGAAFSLTVGCSTYTPSPPKTATQASPVSPREDEAPDAAELVDSRVLHTASGLGGALLAADEFALTRQHMRLGEAALRAAECEGLDQSDVASALEVAQGAFAAAAVCVYSGPAAVTPPAYGTPTLVAPQDAAATAASGATADRVLQGTRHWGCALGALASAKQLAGAPDASVEPLLEAANQQDNTNPETWARLALLCVSTSPPRLAESLACSQQALRLGLVGDTPAHGVLLQALAGRFARQGQASVAVVLSQRATSKSS